MLSVKHRKKSWLIISQLQKCAVFTQITPLQSRHSNKPTFLLWHSSLATYWQNLLWQKSQRHFSQDAWASAPSNVLVRNIWRFCLTTWANLAKSHQCFQWHLRSFVFMSLERLRRAELNADVCAASVDQIVLVLKWALLRTMPCDSQSFHVPSAHTHTAQPLKALYHGCCMALMRGR